MTTTELTQQDVEARIAGLDEETQRRTVCAMVGHSDVVTQCFGYVHCARCEAQIGDTLGGIFDLTSCVIVGHKCETCQTNYEKLDWRHKFMTPNPF